MDAKATRRSHLKLGSVFAIIATVLWAGNYVIARGLHDRIPPVTLASLRWIIAIVVLTPFAYREFLGQRHLVRQHWLYLSITALLGVTMLNTFVYIAGRSTPAINLAMITASSPVFTVLLASAFFQERFTFVKAGGLLLSVGGVMILMSDGVFANILELKLSWGDIWVVMSAITFAGYSTLVKMKPSAINNGTFLLSIFVIGWLFLTPFHIWESRVQGTWNLDLVVMGSLLYLAVGASLLAFLSWNKAIILVGPSAAAVIYYTLPIFSSLEAVIFLGEKLRVVHILSFLLIVGGIVIVNREK